MKFISIDLETLGTNVDSQIIQVGACAYDTTTNTVDDTFEANIKLNDDEHCNVTPGTLKFWLMQATENPEAVASVFKPKVTMELYDVLVNLKTWLELNPDYLVTVYANGTKFDLGMLEYQYKLHGIEVPWFHNADGCMRTIRRLCKERIKVNMSDYSHLPEHSALGDAIWQARYIASALVSINQNGINI